MFVTTMFQNLIFNNFYTFPPFFHYQTIMRNFWTILLYITLLVVSSISSTLAQIGILIGVIAISEWCEVISNPVGNPVVNHVVNPVVNHVVNPVDNHVATASGSVKNEVFIPGALRRYLEELKQNAVRVHPR